MRAGAGRTSIQEPSITAAGSSSVANVCVLSAGRPPRSPRSAREGVGVPDIAGHETACLGRQFPDPSRQVVDVPARFITELS